MATTRSSAARTRCDWFDLDHVGRSPSRFDLKKLENLNGHYLREADRRGWRPWSRRRSPARTPSLLARAMPVLTPRAKDLNELAEGAAFLFKARPLDMDEKAAALLEGDARDLLARVHAALSGGRATGRPRRRSRPCGRLPKPKA